MRRFIAVIILQFCCATTGALAQTTPAAPSCSDLHLIPAPRECTAVQAIPIRGCLDVFVMKNAEDEFAAKDVRQAVSCSYLSLLWN